MKVIICDGAPPVMCVDAKGTRSVPLVVVRRCRLFHFVASVFSFFFVQARTEASLLCFLLVCLCILSLFVISWFVFVCVASVISSCVCVCVCRPHTGGEGAEEGWWSHLRTRCTGQ